MYFQAAEMLLYSHKMSAKEALECGFVNDLYKPEEIQSKVWDKIVEISKLSQDSITKSKKLMRRTIQDELLRTNEIEIEELNNLRKSNDAENIASNFQAQKSKL